jgi:hypothetical protein
MPGVEDEGVVLLREEELTPEEVVVELDKPGERSPELLE